VKENWTSVQLTKTDIIRSLVLNLKQVSFESDNIDLVFVTNTKGTKTGVIVECTDGTKIALDIKNIN
jgi:hypothetical protein